MSDKNVLLFNSKEFGEVRTIVVNDVPYFVASDIAKALGYKNVSRDIQRHCKKVEKMEVYQNGTSHKTARNAQEMLVVPESDVYRLIMKSTLPSAEKFESWVMEEVLPTIRKTGGYVANTNMFVEEYFADLDPNVKLILTTALDQVKAKDKIIAQQDEVIQIQTPKAIFADAITGADTNITIAELAKLLSQNGYKTGQNRLYTELREKGFVMNTKSKETNCTPTQLAVELGVLTIRETTVKIGKDDNKKTIINRSTRVTPKGQKYFIKKLCPTS